MDKMSVKSDLEFIDDVVESIGYNKHMSLDEIKTELSEEGVEGDYDEFMNKLNEYRKIGIDRAQKGEISNDQ
jgi:hypothetical protein